MSFAWTAIALTVASTAYNADKSRKAANAQMDAINVANSQEATDKAAAENTAAANANARIADTKRRRRSSSLLSTLGGAADPLGTGGAPGSMGPQSPGTPAAGGGGGGGGMAGPARAGGTSVLGGGGGYSGGGGGGRSFGSMNQV